MRILIAEDEDVLREVIARVMRRAGHDVTEALNAEEALLAFRENPFPLVVTDIVMGAMSGLDLLRTIRMQDPEALIVVMTSHASLETATAAVRAGAYDFIIKPFEDLSVIQAMVRRAEDRIRLLEENRRLRENLGQATDKIDALDRALVETAVRDPLTGLHNQRSFVEMLDAELTRGRRHKRTFSLVLLEVGITPPAPSPAVDRFLRTAASVLASRCRTTDVAGRSAPTGFTIVLPETDRRGAEVFAETLCRQIEATPFHAIDEDATTTAVVVTAGVASFPEDGDTANLLFDVAGAALTRVQAQSGAPIMAWPSSGRNSDLPPAESDSGDETRR